MSAGVAYSNTQAITLTNVGTSGQVLTSNGSGSAPSFQAGSSGSAVKFISNLSAVKSNVTGDGSQYRIVCNNVTVNVGSAYNPVTGIFTAPATGAYAFAFDVFLSNLDAAHSDFTTYFPSSGSSSDRILALDPYISQSSTALFGCSQFAVKQLNSGQSVFVLIEVSGGTKTVAVVGDPTDPYTYFSGWSL